jgi:hypothetical protein
LPIGSGTEGAYTICMKVEGPGKTSGPKGVSKTGAKRGASGASFGSMIDETSETEGAAPAAGVMPIAGIDALLSLQGAEDSIGGGGRKNRQRAESLLDELDKLRIGILSGGIPVSTLRHLSHMVTSRREAVMDPALGTLLDEIDLRVQVELAKHDRK